MRTLGDLFQASRLTAKTGTYQLLRWSFYKFVGVPKIPKIRSSSWESRKQGLQCIGVDFKRMLIIW